MRRLLRPLRSGGLRSVVSPEVLHQRTKKTKFIWRPHFWTMVLLPSFIEFHFLWFHFQEILVFLLVSQPGDKHWWQFSRNQETRPAFGTQPINFICME